MHLPYLFQRWSVSFFTYLSNFSGIVVCYLESNSSSALDEKMNIKLLYMSQDSKAEDNRSFSTVKADSSHWKNPCSELFGLSLLLCCGWVAVPVTPVA